MMGLPVLAQAAGRLETVALERGPTVTENALGQVESVAKEICDLAAVAC
jgi:hypothetical protein